MENWIQLIISFILGGGLLTFITVRYSAKGAKLDAYSKIEDFWKASNESLRTEFKIRLSELEARITELELNSCRRQNCNLRIK